MSYLDKYNETPEAYAARIVGNWADWENFVWNQDQQPADAHRCAIIYTSNRDSDTLERSNEACIRGELESFTGDLSEGADVQLESHNHWAVGHVDGFAIRVYALDGAITQAFKAWYELCVRLEDYPILDENDFSEREHDAAQTMWRECMTQDQRVCYIRDHRSQFEFSDLADMMACVRGKFFGGYYSELLSP